MCVFWAEAVAGVPRGEWGGGRGGDWAVLSSVRMIVGFCYRRVMFETFERAGSKGGEGKRLGIRSYEPPA